MSERIEERDNKGNLRMASDGYFINVIELDLGGLVVLWRGWLSRVSRSSSQ